MPDVLTAPPTEPATTAATERHDRRSFLRNACIGLGVVVVAGDAIAAYRAYDQGVLNEGRGPAFEPWHSWHNGQGTERFVRAAILAANAHNTQPWLFELGTNRVDLHADLTRRTGANDPADRELDTSLGCALENLLIAARANGFAHELTAPAANDPTLVASVTFAAAPVNATALHDAIAHRRSNRSVYRSDPVPAATLLGFDALVDSTVAPARLVWLTSTADRTTFADLLADAAAAHTADEEQSIASYQWWRSTWDDVHRQRDGLSIDGAGLRPVARTIGKLIGAATPSDTDRRFNDRNFVKRTRQQAQSAAAFGVIIVDDPTSRAQRVAGGRLLQRLHLHATTRRLGFQHMNQVTERIDRDTQLARASAFAPALDALTGPGVLAAFRIGTPTVAALPSARRPVTAVLR